MSDFTPENSPKESSDFTRNYVERALLDVENDITRLLTEVDGVDLQLTRGPRTPTGIIRVQRSLFICEVSSADEPNYLSVVDAQKTTPRIGGQFYRIREERIPISDNRVHPLMLDYSFRTSKSVDLVGTNSKRVAYSKSAKLSVTEKTKPDLLRKFPFQNNVNTHLEDSHLLSRASNKANQDYCGEEDPSKKRKYRPEVEDIEQLEKTIGQLLHEFVDINY